MNFDISSRIVFSSLAGSRLYGCHTLNSDWDIRGCVIPPASYFIGLDCFEQHEISDPRDEVYYDIRKFVRLAMNGNPNVLELFWSPPELHERVENPHGIALLRMAPLFVTKTIIKPHIGMATAHLKKLERTWKPKDAACVIRVLSQCEELLARGKITLPRPEAGYLCDIRADKVPLEDVRQDADRLIEAIRRHEVDCDWPAKPNYAKVNQKVSSIVASYLESKGEI